MITSYNASAVNIYNAASSLMRFENNFFSFLKNALAYVLQSLSYTYICIRRIGPMATTILVFVGLAPWQ
jgi:hypothetical protein